LCHYKDSAGKHMVLIDMPNTLAHIDNTFPVVQGRLIQKVTEAIGPALLRAKSLIIGLIEGLQREVAEEQRRRVTSLKEAVVWMSTQKQGPGGAGMRRDV
jgi:hypothetical protein